MYSAQPNGAVDSATINPAALNSQGKRHPFSLHPSDKSPVVLERTIRCARSNIPRDHFALALQGRPVAEQTPFWCCSPSPSRAPECDRFSACVLVDSADAMCDAADGWCLQRRHDRTNRCLLSSIEMLTVQIQTCSTRPPGVSKEVGRRKPTRTPQL